MSSIDVVTNFWIDKKKVVATLIDMGRKRLTDAVRRDKPLRVRLRPGEREIIDMAAEAEDLSTSEWVRRLAIKAASLEKKRAK